MPRQKVDSVLRDIARYAVRSRITRRQAYEMARYCLLDSMACGLDGQAHPDCARLLGPVVQGATLKRGARVPGTGHALEPVKAAFDISTAIRWLEYSDTWFGTDGGHPSDTLGAIIGIADYLSRSGRPISMHDFLEVMIKTYEIHGVLLMNNNFIDKGMDGIGVVAVASAAMATRLLGGSEEQIVNAVSNAWIDGFSPRIYRIGHNAGPRKAWAAGDAASRGVRHALMAMRGEPGYGAALTTPKWGVSDALMHGDAITLAHPLGTHIVENVLFKLPFPAQFHTQTAAECALRLHPLVKDRIGDIRRIHMQTHAKAIQSTSKTGPLHNAASRDHCIQYVAAVVLLYGDLTTDHYEDHIAADRRIDRLRALMTVTENKRYTRDFYADGRKTNTNSMQIEFRDGSRSDEIVIEHPLGHPSRRREALPLVEQKFRRSVVRRLPRPRHAKVLASCADLDTLQKLSCESFMSLFAIGKSS